MQKKRFFIIGIITIFIVAIATVIGYAANVNNYAIEIVDDGSTHLATDEHSSINKQIIQDNLEDFVYEVKVKNTQPTPDTKELAILIDNSNSMKVNDEQSITTVKERAVELVNGAFSKVSGLKLSLSDNTGVKRGLSTSSANVVNIVNSIQFNSATMLEDGITQAVSTFSNTDGVKYLVIFTDATDGSEQIAEIRNRGIEVVWITTDMTRTSLGTPAQPLQGDMGYVSDENLSFEFIYNELNRAIYNIVVTDTFSDEVNTYFDFEIVQKNQNQEFEKTQTGYIWKPGTVNSQQVATLQFKLKLKETANVDSGIVYRHIQTSNKVEIKYDKYKQENNKYETEQSPIFAICDKYSVTLRAVSAENRKIILDGIKFKVVGTDENGKEVYNKTLTTDIFGQVYVEDLKTLGTVHFMITPEVEGKIGYVTTPSKEITIVNDALGRGLSLKTDKLYNEIDNNKRNMLIEIPINVQHFIMEVLIKDLDYPNVMLGEADFRLIQPKLNSKYEMDALYGTTDKNGVLIFNPTVMTKDGTYDYILSQMSEQPEYETMGNVTLSVTFEKGSVKKIEKKHNDKVTTELISEEHVRVNVGNKSRIEETFNLEVSLAEKENKSVGIAGAKYTISVTRENGATSTYVDQVTDQNGKINIVVPGNGFVQIKITEQLPKPGYIEDKTTKEIIVYRHDKRVQYVAKTTPNDIETQVDSDADKLIVKLYSQSKSNQNIVQIQLADLAENDIFIEGVEFGLIGPLTGENYTGAKTDKDGLVSFAVYGQPQGSYPYQITVNNATIPYGYSPIQGTLDISIRYDENGQIQDVSDTNGANIFTCYQKIIEDNNNNKVYATAYVGVGLEVNAEDANYFQIKLTDRYNGNIPVVGATYDITITSGVVTREIKGRKTDSAGMIQTRIIGSSDEVTIKLKQKETIKSYVMDDQEQIIELRKVNGVYTIVHQEPYDFTDGKRGAKEEGRNIVFYHVNEKKTGDNVLLNLYINKMDEEDNLLGNIPIKISSDTLLAPDGTPLNIIKTTDSNGYLQLEEIQVKDMVIPGEREYFLYLVELDDITNQNEKLDTQIKVKLTFRYNENKDIVELTNVEPTWGNRLIKNKTFNGYETSKAYESNIFFDIYGNYGDVGNFSIDLVKKNIDANTLYGVKYDVFVMRPDGSSSRKQGIEIKDSVEIPGIIVTTGTVIEMTEVEAPVGYEVNPTTQIFEITNIDENTGEVTIQKTSGDTSTQITSTQLVPLADGKIKTCVVIELVDAEMNTFKFGIKTVDSTNSKGVPGYSFKIKSSRGASNVTEVTTQEGITNTKVGGTVSLNTINYTITEIKTATYYKPLAKPINLVIAFTVDGKVDITQTMSIQTDSNYGKTWSISGSNSANGNDIDITILVEPQDTLNVLLQTIDKITGQTIQNPTYQIKPSINLSGVGSDSIQVGYVQPNSTQPYTFNQTTATGDYFNVQEQQFTITYNANGQIQSIDSVSSELNVTTTQNQREILVKVYLEPRVPFVIENEDYFRQTPIQGAKFNISSTEGKIEIVTDDQGNGNGTLGHLGTDITIRYNVEQTETQIGYAKVDNFQIDVTYNANREIIDAVMVGDTNRWVEISHIQPSTQNDYGYNGNDKGIVKIKIKSYPELIVNIENVDRLDNTITLAGTQYEVVSTIPTQASGMTSQNGTWDAHLGKTLLGSVVTYTIREKSPAALYQTLESEIVIEVTYDGNGYVNDVRITKGDSYATASMLPNVVDPEDNFKFNVQIKNNKKIKFNITLTHNQDSNIFLQDSTFRAIATLDGQTLSMDEVPTDKLGKAMLSLDKALANKTIEYTIKQIRKTPGYEFPNEDIKIEITYDSEGRLVQNSCRIIAGTKYAQITGINDNTFEVDLHIVNEEIKEFGLNIRTTDKYDANLGLPNINYNAHLVNYFTDQYGNQRYEIDYNYVGNTKTDQNGEGYIRFGKYNADGSTTRRLVVNESNVPGTHRTIEARILIDVDFDENGRITGTRIVTGYDKFFGYGADERFLEVTHTNYTISLRVKHFPWIDVSLSVQDIYTQGKLSGRIDFSSKNTKGSGGVINIDSIASAPTFTTGLTSNTTQAYVTGHFAPAEQSMTRRIYLYEMDEPTSPMQYQQYRPKSGYTYYGRYIGAIDIEYNNKGRIQNATVVEEHSNNNITHAFIDVDILSGTNVKVTVKYAPITVIQSTSVDAVTKDKLANVRIHPFGGHSPYEYRWGYWYNTTDNQGTTTYSYWDANMAGAQNRYFINSEFIGSEYNGYYNPGEVKLDIGYDSNGRIIAANVISTDVFGKPNAEVVGWNNNFVHINILHQRKFNLKINKTDIYDATANITAGFTLSGETTTQINSGQSKTVGRIIPGETVKYTVSETSVPGNYIPITNFDFYVYFKNDGTVGKAWSNSKYFEFVSAAEAQPGKNGINVTDLEITIKNEPRFTVKLGLSDEFYPELKLENATFEMTNSKGDSAIGNPKTDGNGYLNTYIGPAYPNETVTYTIRQTNTINGYYANSQIIEIEVTFKPDGRIENYRLIKGQQNTQLDENAYQNQRYILLNTTNRPKDVKFGIHKYDSVTNQVMNDIKFKISATETGRPHADKQLITNADGNVVEVLDQFIETTNGRIVTYTISEIQVPNTYRKIEDIVLQIKYNEDGSIAYRNVLSNPSGVDVKVALGRRILYNGSQPVHVNLTIPNDNAYDLIIKNEDKNYPGLGVEGTIYDITINGSIVRANPTNENGITRISKLTQKGEITIRISENQVGKGYRKDINNDTTVVIQKGENVYSLALDSNSNPTYADVVVDEAHGTVTVTFKNETLSELKLIKDDIVTGELLPNTTFEITAQEKDTYGNDIGNEETITQVGIDDVTNEQGELYFDLGITPQNKIIEYTFKEISVSNPDKYDLIGDIKVLVEYNMYGKIESITKNSYRAQVITDINNPNRIMVMISNGVPEVGGTDGIDPGENIIPMPIIPEDPDNPNPMPTYKLKVISEDAQTKLRINGSIFDIEVNTPTGAQEVRLTNKVTGNVTKQGYVIDQGMLVMTNLREPGQISVQINQTKTAEGYIFGKQQTSGTVTYNASYIPGTTPQNSALDLQLIDDGGFETIIDNTNKEIIIKVKNESEVILDITKQLRVEKFEGGKELQPLEGINFEVTAKIQTSTSEQDTNLRVTSAMTDKQGKTKVSLGTPYPGKNVLYNIHEIQNEGYKYLGDVILSVQYDTRGLIKYAEILSNADQAQISEATLKTRRPQVTIINEQADFADRFNYTIVLEKHHIDDPTYDELIPGASYEIKVEEEYGEKSYTWRSTTNKDGLIISQDFNGYGRIRITLTELTAPDGYKLDKTQRFLQIYRNKATGVFNIEDSNVGYAISEDNREVYVKPVDEPSDNTYSLIINKSDADTNAIIMNNPAEFEINRIQRVEVPIEDGIEDEEPATQIVELKEKIEKAKTDEKGKLIMANFPSPEEEGTYTYVIKETQAPTGYKAIQEELLLDITFAKDEKDNMIITDIVNKSPKYITILSQKKQTLNIIIKNRKNYEVKEGMFGIDITKIDKETQNVITKDTAVFKMTNPDGTYSYFETDEKGQISIDDLMIPTEATTVTYILNEIKAPEGYLLVRDDITITITTALNEEEKIYIESIQIDGTNIIEDNTGITEDNRIKLKVTNKKGELSPGDINTKTYNLTINKLDKDTKQIIPNVDFKMSLVNGEIIKSATNDEGKIILENVYMPAQPGEYDIVIEEISTPDGYQQDKDFKILKVTFDGYGDNMVITKLQLESQHNKNIDIVSASCTQANIELNVYNQANNGDDDLYVRSKKHDDGRYIYDFYYNGIDLTHYKIDVPFIDNIATGSISKFLQNIDTNATKLELFDQSGKLITTGRIRTGLKLVATKGNQTKEFMVVVPGDTDQNGRIDQNDFEKVSTFIAPDVNRRKKTEITLAESIVRRAADVAVKIGRVDQNDYEQLVNKAANM